MEPINENIVTGETKSGIRFTIDKRIKDDSRTLFYVRNMRKNLNSEEDKLNATDAVYSLLELIFGSNGGLEVFLNEVAYRHDGIADVQSLLEELTDIFEAIGLKNSLSSQT